MIPTEFKALLDDSLDPQTFVRKALGLLESQFRTIALLALADWQRQGIYSTELFQAIASLQRPSWGHWNGLLSALRNARKQVLRSHPPEERQKLEEAIVLKRALDTLEEPLPRELVVALQPLAALLNQKLRQRHRIGQLLTLPIAMRNRIAHDVPNDTEWWQTASAGLRHLLGFHVERDLCQEIRKETAYPTPWFLPQEESTKEAESREIAPVQSPDDLVWAFNGVDQNFAVLYVHPHKRTRHRKDATQSMLLAFQQLLGRADAYEDDFRKLLSKHAPEDLKGVIMGDFLVGRPVGSGGFATVHIGRQLSTGRHVAIKILHDGMDEEMAERFRQEARYLSQFRHPHIVGVLSYGEETWRAPRQRELVRSLKEEQWYQRFSKSAPVKTYIALEWVEGYTLEAIFQGLHRNRPPESRGVSRTSSQQWDAPGRRELATWYAQAANALTAVHALGLIHRDVKPANLMVNDKGQLKLMDFGIARSQDENRTLVTTFGHGIGTPAYMSPEQIKASHGDATLGPNTDIYSLSATFYELFTGKRLYHHDQETMESVQTKKLGGELPLPPRAAVEGLPWEIETILMGGLQAEISDRYASMEALEQDIRRYLSDEPITYKRPSLFRQLQLNYRRHRMIYQLVTLFVLLVGSGLYTHLQQLTKERDKTAKARWQAVKQYKQAEKEKRRALHSEWLAQRAEASAKRAETSAKRLAKLANKRAQQARKATRHAMLEKRNVEIQRQKLLAIQKRFLQERLLMVNRPGLNSGTVETILLFFEEVLIEPSNPLEHHKLALQGIHDVFQGAQRKHKLYHTMTATLMNRLFGALLMYALRNRNRASFKQMRHTSAHCALLLAPHIDVNATTHQQYFNQLTKQYNASALRALWHQSMLRRKGWLPPIVKLASIGLQDPDIHIKMSIAGTLLAMGYAKAFALRKLFFPTSQWKHRVSEKLYMELFGLRRMPDLHPVPIAVLEELGDAFQIRTRMRALTLLSRKGPRGLAIITSALDDNSWRVRRHAKKLLARAGRASLPHLKRALSEHDQSLHYGVLSTLKQIGPAAIPLLVTMLTHRSSYTSYRVRRSLSRLLQRHKKIKLQNIGLLPLLTHRHRHVRSQVLRLLGRLSPSTLQPHLMHIWKRTKDRSTRVRSRAYTLLSTLEFAQLKAPLYKRIANELAKQRPSRMRAALCSLLGHYGAKAITQLLTCLKDSRSYVRTKAKEGLLRVGTPAIAPLRRLLRDNNWVLRQQAIDVLGQLAQRNSSLLHLLAKVSQDKDSNVRFTALKAMLKLGAKALPFLDAMHRDPSRLVRLTLAKRLGTIGAPAIPLLYKLTRDGDSYTRKNAYNSLNALPPPIAIDLDVLEQSKSKWYLRRHYRHLLKHVPPKTLLQLALAPTNWSTVLLRRSAIERLCRIKQKGIKYERLANLAFHDPSNNVRRAVIQCRMLPFSPNLKQRLIQHLELLPANVMTVVLSRLIDLPLRSTIREQLVKKALNHNNYLIRHYGFRHVKKLPANRQLKWLALATRDPYSWNRTLAIRLLRKLATKQAKRPPILALLTRFLKEHLHNNTARRSIFALASFGDDAVPLIQQAYREPATRKYALKALSRMKLNTKIQVASASRIAKKSLQAPRLRERIIAARIIGKLGGLNKRMLARVFRQKEDKVRQAASHGLRLSHHWVPSLRPILLSLLEDKATQVRRHAIMTLHQLKEDALPQLRKAMLANGPALQYVVQRALMKLKENAMGVFLVLRDGLATTRRYYRRQTKKRIIRLLRANPMLGMLLSSALPSSSLRQRVRALHRHHHGALQLAQWLYREPHPIAMLGDVGWSWQSVLREWRQSSRAILGRSEIVRLLGEICDPEAVAHLQYALLRDESVRVRTEAAFALGRLGTLAKTTVPLLRRAMRDPAPEVRAAARASHQRLTRPSSSPEDTMDKALRERCLQTAHDVVFGSLSLATSVP